MGKSTPWVVSACGISRARHGNEPTDPCLSLLWLFTPFLLSAPPTAPAYGRVVQQHQFLFFVFTRGQSHRAAARHPPAMCARVTYICSLDNLDTSRPARWTPAPLNAIHHLPSTAPVLCPKRPVVSPRHSPPSHPTPDTSTHSPNSPYQQQLPTRAA